ncbi:MAG: DUF5615 family PIN-like protein [Verrucomicrobia bacterium]|nr:DUF5615 family PIN-like protein [Verrucomicrobiota bacterium]MDA1066301.1 DUF5615 family PIN-like protein [Verrucomicrobiota bacterium]
MRILLDENLDWRLCRELSGNEVTSVSKTDLAGLNNGALLAKAEEGFDVFVTIDAGLPYQQNIQSKKIAVVVLKAKTNRLEDTIPLMPKLLELLPTLAPGKLEMITLS